MKVLALGFLAILPLQWFVIPGVPLGAGRLHLMAMLVFTGIVALRYRARTHASLLRITLPFLIPNVYLLFVWSTVSLYNGTSLADPVQELLKIVTFIALGTIIYRAGLGLDGGVVEALRWTATAACSVFLAGLAVSMIINGVNPAEVFGRTLATGDPNVLQKELFLSSFSGFGYEAATTFRAGVNEAATARGSIRHEMFGAVLLAMYVSSWAVRMRPFTLPRHRGVYLVSMSVGTVLILLSMSRAVLLAAFLWLVVIAVRQVFSGQLTTRQVAWAYGGFGAVAVLAVSGFGSVLWNRLTEDTSSYEERERRIGESVELIRTHFLTGGVDTAGQSSHNFVLEAWLLGGVGVAVLAAVVVLMTLALWLWLLARVHAEPAWMLPVVAALAFPLVRFMTAGGGLLPPVGWITLGFVGGALTLRQELRRRRTESAGVPVPLATR